MAGHNKWSKIKRLKAVLDAKKGKIFSRYSKEIAVAVRLGGADAAMNPRLRAAIQAARAENMPNDNIERAIKKGSGEAGSGQVVEELVYEGYTPGGAALLIEAASDNKNRTAADLRAVFNKHGGSLATSGSTAFLFQRLGTMSVEAPAESEDALLEVLLPAGAEDCVHAEGEFRITTPPDRLYAVVDALREAGHIPRDPELAYEPKSTTSLDEATERKALTVCEALEDLDDVLRVHTNLEIGGETE